MRNSLLHALFPLVRAEILRLLFTNRPQELYVRELARLSFLALRTVQDELAKLQAAQLVLSRTNGYHRFYRANRQHPLYPNLRRIVIMAAAQPRPKVTSRKSSKATLRVKAAEQVKGRSDKAASLDRRGRWDFAK